MSDQDPKIRQGGLMRCCIHALLLRKNEGEPSEQELYRCPHCGGWMRFRDGAWEWRRMETPAEGRL